MNLKWGVLWVVSVCWVKPRCVLCITHVQSEWNFNFLRLRSALCWDISQRIVAIPYPNCLVKWIGFYVSSILFLKTILDNRRDLYRFNSDLNDAFPSPGFTSEKWKSFRCILSFIWFKTYMKRKSSSYFMNVYGVLPPCEADLASQFWFVKEFSYSTMELLTQDFRRVVRRESSVNIGNIERNVASSLFPLFLLFQEITLQVRKAYVNADDLSKVTFQTGKR